MSRLTTILTLVAVLVLTPHHSADAVSPQSAATPSADAPVSATPPSARDAGGTADGDLNSSWTWAAIFAGVGVVVTLTALSVTIVHRRRDKLAQLLEPVDILIDDIAVAVDKLASLPATQGDMADLGQLRRRIKQAEKTFHRIPIGAVVAAIEAYEKTALPNDFAKQLAEEAAGEILGLSRQQGSRIEAVRAAIDAAQSIIKGLRKV
ncbi:hypothetical protein [Streptomyces sp. NPDC093591]|uniref:hypothetical protein n=1 Tax=Streptomyces sp. NPDC093591 TaxID=3366044 RepID=UPI003807A520